MKDKKTLWTLFSSTFYLSAFTFGGGYVIVPLMEQKFVEELGWIDEEEMMDIVALAQSAPGSLSVQSAVAVGYKIAGFTGALVAAAGTFLPPFTIMTIVSYAYLAIRDNHFVQNLLMGMQAGVAAIIINVVYNMAANIVRQKKMTPILVMIGALIAELVFDANILYVLLIAALIGGITTIWDIKKEAAFDNNQKEDK